MSKPFTITKSLKQINFRSKKTKTIPRESLIAEVSALQHRRMKTRNGSIQKVSLKDMNSPEISHKKIKVLAKSSYFGVAKRGHKRSGTTLVNSSLRMSSSLASNSKGMINKKSEKLKLSKDIMRRLKRRSISINDKKFDFSLEKSRKNELSKIGCMIDKSMGGTLSALKKHKRKKNFPLPLSKTSKKLKKTIDSRLGGKHNN